MKILINDIAASSGGALSILKSFYEQAKLDKKNDYIFLLSDNYIEETDNIKIIKMPENKRWINRLKFDLITGKRFIKKLNIDKILSLQNTIIFGARCKQEVYVHQSIPFQNIKRFSFFKKEECKLAIIQYLIGYVIKKSIKKADKVIVQTEWMKKAIIKKTKINENIVTIIRPKVETNGIKVNKNIETNKFFYPASNILYKNFECIYKACEILINKKIKNFSVELTIKGKDTNQIKYLDTLTHDEVLNKYANSILIFPSYIETAGLPLLEAKNVGNTILAADTSFSREFLNDYEKVYFFNPFKPEELANLMEKCISKIKDD